MFDNHTNLAVSTVATAPTPPLSGTSLSVAAGDGALFPAPPFNCVVYPANSSPTHTNSEIIRVTGKTSDTFTIARAQEGSTARSIQQGDIIDNVPTTLVFGDLEAAAMLNFMLA